MVAVNNILVATDFGDASEAALLYGRALAYKFGARLHVLHVLENGFLRATVLDPGAVEAAALRRLHNRITDDDRQTLRAEAVIVKSDAPAAEVCESTKPINPSYGLAGYCPANGCGGSYGACASYKCTQAKK
jgi:nucleotide-binding universal stress UspA family protein